jgi:hypothetical protein
VNRISHPKAKFPEFFGRFPLICPPRLPFNLVKILIVKLSAIGDIVHTLPALNAIRAARPDAVISWVAEERSAEILRGNPMIDNLIEVNTRSLRGRKIVEKMLIEVCASTTSMLPSTFKAFSNQP